MMKEKRQEVTMRNSRRRIRATVLCCLVSLVFYVGYCTVLAVSALVAAVGSLFNEAFALFGAVMLCFFAVLIASFLLVALFLGAPLEYAPLVFRLLPLIAGLWEAILNLLDIGQS
jgi:hypothetical protein